MLIPKSYLTTPKPPAWYYENIHMTDTNTELMTKAFADHEIILIRNAKAYVEEAIPDWVKSNAYVVVAGGCFASRMQSELIKDIDIFVLGHSDPEEQKRMHDAVRRKMQISFPTIDDKTQSYARNNDAVEEVWTDNNRKVQYIFTNHKSREDLINDFDYVHCMTSYHLHKLYITRKIYDAIVNKHLVVNNGKNVQEWRRSKFRDRGYKDVNEQMLPEPTLGDILAGALKKASTTVATGGGKTAMANKTTWIDWTDPDKDDDFSWVR